MTIRPTPRPRPRFRGAQYVLRGVLYVTALAGAVTVASAVPAAAATERNVHYQPIGVLTAIAIYVGIPLAIFVLAALAVYAPSSARGPRYRPGLGWWAAPVWFNGPHSQQDPSRGALTARERQHAELSGQSADVDEASGATAVSDTGGSLSSGGGASARW